MRSDIGIPSGGGLRRRRLVLNDIQIRDPYLLRAPDGGGYYMFGSTDKNIWEGPGEGFDAYHSDDLTEWDGPIPVFRPPAGFWSTGMFWAPEVHPYHHAYYMFATFTGENGDRGTQILRSEAVEGPYVPWSDGPVTPAGWQCLDGTLHVDDAGRPWIVYCHEWTQIGDGSIRAQRLSADLRQTVGDSYLLFTASEAPWSMRQTEGPFASRPGPSYVTDGPFLHRLSGGHLIMLWSSLGTGGYAMGIAHSESGNVIGPWRQESEPLWGADGGHGMIVVLEDGSLALTLHQPNATPSERAVVVPLIERPSTVEIAECP